MKTISLLFFLIIFFFIIKNIKSEQTEIYSYNFNNNNNNINNINNSNNLINIYLSLRFGNDSSGNGTLSNPFQTFCKIESVLKSQNNNNLTITVNVGYGLYDQSNCIYFSLDNINYDIIIKSYNDSNNIGNTMESISIGGSDGSDGSSSSSDNNEIIEGKVLIHIYLNIINCKIIFKGPSITIYTSGLEVYNNSIIEFSNGVLVNFGYEDFIHQMISSKLILINSSISYNSYGALVLDDCIMDILDNSTLNNITFSFNPNELSAPFKGIKFTNSLAVNSMFGMGTYDLNVTNSILQDCVIESSGFTTISRSRIEQTISNNLNLIQTIDTNSMINLYATVYTKRFGARLFINHTKIITSPTINALPILEVYANSYTNIANSLISGYRKTTPIILAENGGDSCTVELKHVHIENCISSSLASLAMSTLTMYNISFKNNYLDSMVVANDASSIELSDTVIKCEDNNQFLSTITMPINPNSPYSRPFSSRSTVVLSNMNLQCVGPFDFQNSTVTFLNITMSSLFQSAYVSLYSNTTLDVATSSFSSSSYNGGQLFSLGDSGILYILYCNFNQSASSIVQGNEGSTAFIDYSNFYNIKSDYNALFVIANSSLIISNCYFENIQTSQTSLISGTDSIISIENTTLKRIGVYLMETSDCKIFITDVTMTNCFTLMNKLFISVRDHITIHSSRFIDNHGYGGTLISTYSSTIIFSVVEFNGNSFTPLLSSLGSSVYLTNVTYYNNSGSFIGSTSDLVEINQFQYENNKAPCDYLFSLSGSSPVIMKSITIENNYFSQYLIFFTEVHGIEISNFQFINNIVVSVNSPSPFFGIGYFNATLQFTLCSNISIDGLRVENNSIGSVFLSNYLSDLVLNNLFISSNTFSDKFGDFLKSSNSSLIIESSDFQNNINSIDSVLLSIIDTNTTIDDCIFFGNQNPNGIGSVLNLAIENQLYYFTIINSLFDSNFALNGGVFGFTGISDYNEDAFINPLSKFNNNTFKNNFASQKGGVIYTDYFTFSNNISNILNLNNFENNTSLLGPNFSSEMNFNIIEFSNLPDGSTAIIKYRFIDYYNNTFTLYSDELNFKIIRNSNDDQIIYENNVMAGQGSFFYNFLGKAGEKYTFEFNNPFSFNQTFFVGDCLPYQIYLNSSETCSYCQNNYAYSQSYGKCYSCDSEIMTCLTSTVFAIDGYYIVNNDVSMVEQCPLDMCLSYNLCTSNSSFGDLCFSCKDEYGNLVQTKNGIRCCSHFKPILLIPILAFHLLFSLVLSLIKHNSFRIPINQIIIFLQINSVVFFSYSGIYILPLFRMSVDMLDGYCLWEGLNYNFKSFLSFSIIISLFLIGSTDITPSIIIKIYKKISTRKDNRNLSLLINDRNITPLQQQQQPIAKYPNYIIKILEGKIKHRSIYYWKSIWSLFQLFVIPLAFNAMSLVISKQVGSENYLAVDFSIDFQSNSNQACILIAILIFIILAIVLFMQLILLLSKFKIGGNRIFKNRITESLLKIQQYQLEYRTNFKWFPIVINSRSIIICVLSIVLLFKAQYYIPIILLIQIFYTIISLLINPIKWKYLRDFNNIINLLQVVILITANSNLLQSKSLFNEGLIITIITFSFALLSIISIFLLYNGKNKKIRRKLK